MSNRLKKMFGESKVIQYWLGSPGKYNPDRHDLDGLPEGDNGGREFALPNEVSPQEFWDQTMPLLIQLQQQAQQRIAIEGRLHPFGILAQGVQVTWIFSSIQITRLQTELLKAHQRIESLEATVKKLQATLEAN